MCTFQHLKEKDHHNESISKVQKNHDHNLDHNHDHNHLKYAEYDNYDNRDHKHDHNHDHPHYDHHPTQQSHQGECPAKYLLSAATQYDTFHIELLLEM